MAIAAKLKMHLDDQGVGYETLAHDPTPSASRTAQASHVSGERLAKAVVLKHEGRFFLAVLPAASHLKLEEARRCLGRPVELATEDEIGPLFPDCAVGAVPAIGAAYGLEAAVDEGLDQAPDVYFEGGDHATVVRVSGEDFCRLTANAARGRIGVHD